MSQLTDLVLGLGSSYVGKALQLSIINTTRATSPALPQLSHPVQHAARNGSSSPALTPQTGLPAPTPPGSALLFLPGEVQGLLS